MRILPSRDPASLGPPHADGVRDRSVAPPGRALATAIAALGLAIAAGAGCEGSLGGDPKDTGPPPPPPTAEQLFAALEPDLTAACGECHAEGNTAFLAAPERYQAIAAWPGIVIKDWDNSLFLTFAVEGGGHLGTNLDNEELVSTLLPKVTEWLVVESQSLPDPIPGLPSVGPFTPILGFNAVYLNDLGPEYQGVAITFTARVQNVTELELSQIEVHPTKQNGVHIVHPVFTQFAKGSADAVPDPNDTFANLNEFFGPNDDGPLGPGLLVLPDYTEGVRLAIVFDAIEPYNVPGTPIDCVDLAGFTANAEPLFTANCTACHGGADVEAAAAVDMSGLLAVPPDSAGACANIRPRVNPAEPAASQIFINTDPEILSGHPFKFNGDATAFGAFRDGVTLWISAEP